MARDADALLLALGTLSLTVGVLALIPLHGKRSGILILHTGLVVMMLSEFITGVYAVEGFMVLSEGQTSNFVENHKEFELAVNHADAKADNVVAIPVSVLRKGGRISHPSLPFDLQVDRYLVNSDLRATEGDVDPHLKGEGLKVAAVVVPEVSGTDEGSDVPSAYVTVLKKGTDTILGKYLVSLFFNANARQRTSPDLPQHLDGEFKDYSLALRAKRSYRPFSIRLLEFRHDLFQGEDRPRNFSSLVRLTDPKENEDRIVKIWMNHPLRYGGETFYQAGFLPGDRGTILQVVRNPGWLMPYISCVMVALGMMIHFGLHLHGFLRKRGVL
jgi:hypothetical protein